MSKNKKTKISNERLKRSIFALLLFIAHCSLLIVSCDGNFVIRELTDPMFKDRNKDVSVEEPVTPPAESDPSYPDPIDTDTITYLVTVNGGTGGGNYAEGADVTITASSLAGLRFIYWTVDSGGVTLADNASRTSTFTMPANDVTVSASFDPASLTGITADYSGTGEIWPITPLDDLKNNLTVTAYYDNGETEILNNADYSLSGTLIVGTSAITVTFGGQTTTFDVTVAATPAHTVTINVNTTGGGTGGSVFGAGSHEWTSSVTITATAETGYTFTGWTVVSGGITLSSDTASTATFTMPNNAVTITANFTPHQYTVVFDIGYISETATALEGVTGSTASQTFTYGTAQNLTANGFAREGFTFAGWRTIASGSGGTLYTAGQSVSNLTATDGDTVTLYAQWNFQYNLGATGPGGGTIFYRTSSGFDLYTGTTAADNSSVKAYYLEVASNAEGIGGIRWSTTATVSIPGLSQNNTDTTDWAIGRGKKNTALIIGYHGVADAPAAAYTIGTFGNGTKNDWFLPSRDELNAFHVFEGMFSQAFWSSSQASATQAWNQNAVGTQSATTKTNMAGVRQVRAF